MPPHKPTIGILTSGGDCPGLNAVIRAAVKSAERLGYDCIGFLRGYEGLVDPVSYMPLTARNTAGILTQGGTILGATNKGRFSATVGGTSGRTYKTITRGWSESAGASVLATLGERFASTFARTRMLIFSEHASGLYFGAFTISRSLVVPAVRPARPGPRDHRRRSRARVAARWAGRLRTARESR